MAGTPIKEKLLADIEASGGWEAIFERVAAGETQIAIAQGFGITQGFFSRVLYLDAARVRAFREAKRQWATALIEQTGDRVNTVPEKRDAIAKVREQASHARWEASKWDREQFGDDVGDLNVNVLNVGQTHLDALRHRMVRTPLDAVRQREFGTPQPLALPEPIDVTPELERPATDPEPADTPEPTRRLGVEWDLRTESVRCLDCDRSDCVHAKREYRKRAQAVADNPPPGPRIIRGIV